MNRLSIRWRLTAWYGVVLLAVLLTFSTAVYFIMRRALIGRLDAAVSEELSEMVREAEHATSWAKLRTELARQFSSHEGYEFQVATVGGEVLFRSRGLGGVSLPAPPLVGVSRHQSYALDGLGAWRVQSRQVIGPERPLLVQAAAALQPVESQMSELLAGLLLAGPLALAAALAGGYALARQALAPVDRMAAAADEITATSLNRRLDVPRANDELGRLARTLNGMIARIQRSFDDIQRFTGDAAHELRTPLSVLRTEAEVALRSPRTPEQYREVLSTMLEEIARMTELAEQLLFLCRLDAGRVHQRREPIAMRQLLRDVADSLSAIAETKGIAMDVRGQEGGFVIGNGPQLRRLVLNLFDNALKYTPWGGRITARTECHAGRVHAIVEDTGIGIAAEHLPRVRERFYRADPSRDHDFEGTGLGLSICQAIAAAHGGELRIESDAGRGTKCSLVMTEFTAAKASPLVEAEV